MGQSALDKASSLKKRIVQAARVLLGGAAPASTAKTRLRPEIPAITPGEVAEARQFFPMDKFFIYGHARSGTTLLARLVRLHPEVHCNYQAHFFTRPPLLQSLVSSEEAGEWLTRRSNRWNGGGDLSAVVLRAAADFILEREARREGKRIVGDKSPNSLLDGEAVRLMHKVYPDGRLIYIIRDGRDTVVSHRFQAFIDSPQHLSPEDLRIREAFSKQPERFGRLGESIFTEKAIQRAAESWVRNVEDTDRLGRELFGEGPPREGPPRERYLAVRYETLLAQPWEEMGRVWSFLGAAAAPAELEGVVLNEMSANPDADWQQQKAGEIAQSLQKGKAGSWEEMFTPRDLAVFSALAGETLRRWGYDGGAG